MLEAFPGIYQTYDELYATYGASSDGYAPGAIVADHDRIRSQIDRGIEDLQLTNSVRGDARLFLLINFSEMIVRPLQRAASYQPPGFTVDMDDVYTRVRYDTATILTQAAKIHAGRARPGDDALISGHDVLDATSQKWDDLLLASRGYWMAFQLPTF